MAEEIVTVKGTPARSLQRFIELELTREQRDEMFASLPADYAVRFRLPVLATETLPVHMLNRLTEQAAAVKKEPVESFARRAGREAAAEAVKGIYRFFALIMTPSSLLSRAAPMWSTLYNRGLMEVVDQKDGGARLRLTNFPSESTGCLRVTGWIERLIELTGARNIRVDHTQCAAKGRPYCEWTMTWGNDER